MRCPSCNRFVSFDTDADPVIEDESLDVEGEGAVISASIRLVNTCMECGEELAETHFELEESLEEPELLKHQGEGHEINLSFDTPTRDERFQTTDRKGKPIKKARYQKHYYSVAVGYTIECSCGEEIATGELSDECAASYMEELV